MRLRQWTFAFLIIAIMLASGCTRDNGKKTMDNKKEQTITYGVGRFVVDIPISMQYRGGSYRMRIRDITEVLWQDGNPNKSAEAEWDARLAKIGKLKPIKGKDNALIEQKEIKGIGKWCKAVFYYGDSFDADSGYLDLLINEGQVGVWITTNGRISGKDFMYEKSTALAKAYRPPAQRLGRVSVLKNVDSFYMQFGAIDLPFEYQESAGIFLEGHTTDKSLKLEIESKVTDEVQPVGLIGRFEAAVETGYAQGLEIKKIRAKERTVAGEKGEEFVYLGVEADGDKGISYLWESPGELNSGQHPELSITMDSDDKNLAERLALWDAILDSMRPAGR